jgi:hypothetical protein
MTKKIFVSCFHKVFVLEVRVFLRSKELPEKAVLFFDNFAWHGTVEELTSGEITVNFFPPKTTT